MTATDPKQPVTIRHNHSSSTQRMLRIFLLAITFFSTLQANAYSCAERLPIDKMFATSEAALVGRVEKKQFDLSISTNRYLVVIKSLKMGEISAEQLVVWTNRPGRCGASLEQGKEYVFFLHVQDGKYWTDVNTSWEVHETTEKHTTEYLQYEVESD